MMLPICRLGYWFARIQKAGEKTPTCHSLTEENRLTPVGYRIDSEIALMTHGGMSFGFA